MNIEETIRLIEALHIAGVTKFKSHEHDIDLRGGGAPSVVHTHSPAGATPAPATIVNKEDTQKALDLINTLKMSPEQLVNQIFPDGAE